MASQAMNQKRRRGKMTHEQETAELSRAVGRHRRTPAHDAPPRVVVLIPAHNEGPTISDTVRAVLGQTHTPDRVIVVADMCTDDGATARAAQDSGAEVLEITENAHKKAGALNQAVAIVLPGLDEHDTVFGFDADTVPDPDFIANALRHHANGYGAVGAVFSGRRGGGLIGLFQRTEFARFQLDQQKRGDRVDVLSGTGWGYTVRSIRRVLAGRAAGRLPCAETPQLWFTAATTEDFELTLAMASTGVRMISPPDCHVTTDVMETARQLWTQRLRWQQGTLDDLRRYGWTRVTRRLIVKQAFTYAMILATPLFLAYLGDQYMIAGPSGLAPSSPVWGGASLLLIADRVWRTRRAGTAGVLLAAAIVPEYLFDVTRQLLYLRALIAHWRGDAVAWGAGTNI